MFGIWNSCEKRFVFGISEPTKDRAWNEFQRVAPFKATKKWRYEVREIQKDWKNPKNPFFERMYSKRKGDSEMTDMFDKFDKEFDPEDLRRQEAEAKERGGDYAEVPWGEYMVKVEQAELKESKSSGKPMVSVWFKIIEGEYKNQMVFYNQVISSGFGLHKADEFLRSLDTGLVVEFKNFRKYNDLLLDIAEAAQDLEYHIKYTESKGKDGKSYSDFEIVEVFETE